MSKPGGSPPVPEADRESILKAYYDDRQGATSIAKDFGIDKKTVYNILVRYGRGTRPRSNRTGETYHKPAGIVEGLTPTGRSRGRQPGASLAVNEYSFAELTPLTAYWIGFLMADGCISQESGKKTPRLLLRLSVKDRKHLERFRDWIGSGHAIYEKDHLDPKNNVQRSCCLQIASSQLCADLKKWGVVERKTGNERPAEVLLTNRDFWRGCVDGDGSVYAGACRVYLSGGESLVRAWATWAKTTYGSEVHLRHHISFCGKKGCWVGDCWKDAGPLLRGLYRSGDMFLARKAAHVLGH